jgi:hypothetical protein
MKQPKGKSRELSVMEKWALLMRIREIPLGLNIRERAKEKQKVLSDFKCADRTLQRIEKSYRDQRLQDVIVPDLNPKKVGRVGAKSKLTGIVKNRLIQINFESRGRAPYSGFIELYKKKYNKTLSKSRLHEYFRKLGMKTRRSYIKPLLTKTQRLRRIEFILSKITGKGVFKCEKNVVHVDEKWFYLVRKGRRIRLQPCGGDFDDDVTQHKSHIEKVMFLSAIGVPQITPDGSYFDGKIGIWPFVEPKIAMRTTNET